ncbi:hypothetical protein AMELA_G00014340 [Ameiurus melas]|uniref:Uncharacterized protein n=1 Tax=Ameiurus melas TaxID=219545 RepID=A0A7J6BHM1_AMEME|nr:hypothetical protein AMELA_G00014340 [Ameiurus melas]
MDKDNLSLVLHSKGDIRLRFYLRCTRWGSVALMCTTGRMEGLGTMSFRSRWSWAMRQQGEWSKWDLQSLISNQAS